MRGLRIGVVGLGLIGGSAARALRPHVGALYAHDIDQSVLDFAREQGIIDGPLLPDRLGEADVVILCAYPAAALSFVREHAPRFKKGAIVTDMLGVKAPLMALGREYSDFTVIGGHPMAGREVSGFLHSSDGLFDGANFIITPPENASEEQIGVVERIARAIGCKTVTRTTAQNHDKIIAYTSQLPHILAVAMCDTPLLVRHKNYTGGSFEDVTRVARINERLWTELFLENRGPLLEEIDRFSKTLADLRGALEQGDSEGLERTMRRVRLDKERIDNA